MRARLEQSLQAIWYGGQPMPVALRLLSRLYGRIANRPRPALRPEVPVIVVGSLLAGGGGKTPTVVAVVKVLQAQGWRVAVISRGYGRRGRRLACVRQGDDPWQVGDEPVLIAAATGAQVWVSRDRRRALQAAVQAGAEVVVADDGLQHRALPRSFECCVIDGQRGVGNGRVLPAGPLRQPLNRLRTVDQLLVPGGDAAAMAERFHLDRQRGHDLYRQTDGMMRLNGSQYEPVDRFAGQAVSLMCGIAHPDGFADSVQSLGMRVVQQRRFADHHMYRPQDVEGLPAPIVVTEKDAVKLRRLDIKVECWVLMSAMVLPQSMVDQLITHVHTFNAEGAGYG
jgi:tetraacyldisaccharide 4'-kinase